MDVLQKEIDEVYATQPTAHETLDYGVVEQHQRFIRSLTEINGGCAVISDLSNRKSYVTVHPWAKTVSTGVFIPKIWWRSVCWNISFFRRLSPCLPMNGSNTGEDADCA